MSSNPQASLVSQDKKEEPFYESVVQKIADGHVESAQRDLVFVLAYLVDVGPLPDRYLFFAVSLLANEHIEIFRSTEIIQRLTSYLRLENAVLKNLKPVQVLSIIILERLFDTQKEWPIEFVDAFIEDSCKDRSWVDDERVAAFVGAVSSSLYSQEERGKVVSLVRSEKDSSDPARVRPEVKDDICRYTTLDIRNTAKRILLDRIRIQLSQPIETHKNTIILIRDTIHLQECREFAVKHLEAWAFHHACVRNAESLHKALCSYITDFTPENLSIFLSLLSTRMKPRRKTWMVDHLASLMNTTFSYRITALKKSFEVELNQGTSRSIQPSSAIDKPLTSILEGLDVATKWSDLALSIQDICLHEETRTHIKPIIRRIVKSTQNIENMVQDFCFGLLQERPDITTLKEKASPDAPLNWCLAMADMVLQVIFASVPSIVVDGPSLNMGGVNRPDAVGKFQNQVAVVVGRVITWCQKLLLPLLLGPNLEIFTQTINRFFFLDQNIKYKIAEWAGFDKEKRMIKFLAEDTPVSADALKSLLDLVTLNCPVRKGDILELAEKIIERNARIQMKYPSLEPIMRVLDKRTIDALLNLSDLELGIPGPRLAIKELYWRSVAASVLLACLYPETAGAYAWQNLPTLRVLMEMIVTRVYTFPPLQIDLYLQSQEQHTLSEEVTAILAMERSQLQVDGKMSDADDLREDNSQLLSLAMIFASGEHCRAPPLFVVEKINKFNEEFNLARRLSVCRAPAYLRDILSKQDTSGSKEWLIPLLQIDSDLLNSLDVSYLFDLMLSYNVDQNPDPHFPIGRLVDIMKQRVLSPEGPISKDLLSNLTKDLSTRDDNYRSAVVKSLSAIFAREESRGTLRAVPPEYNWIWDVTTITSSQIELIKYFGSVAKAVLVEKNTSLIIAYLQYISEQEFSATRLFTVSIHIPKAMTSRKLVFSKLLQESELCFHSLRGILCALCLSITENLRTKQNLGFSEDTTVLIRDAVVELCSGPFANYTPTGMDNFASFLQTLDDFKEKFGDSASLFGSTYVTRLLQSSTPELRYIGLRSITPENSHHYYLSQGIPSDTLKEIESMLHPELYESDPYIKQRVAMKSMVIQHRQLTTSSLGIATYSSRVTPKLKLKDLYHKRKHYAHEGESQLASVGAFVHNMIQTTKSHTQQANPSSISRLYNLHHDLQNNPFLMEVDNAETVAPTQSFVGSVLGLFTTISKLESDPTTETMLSMEGDAPPEHSVSEPDIMSLVKPSHGLEAHLENLYCKDSCGFEDVASTGSFLCRVLDHLSSRPRCEGLYLDWVHMLIPCCRDMTIFVDIFRRNRMSRTTTISILDCLFHTLSWNNMRALARLLLSSQIQDLHLDLVLGFIQSFMRHPKSWFSFISSAETGGEDIHRENPSATYDLELHQLHHLVKSITHEVIGGNFGIIQPSLSLLLDGLCGKSENTTALMSLVMHYCGKFNMTDKSEESLRRFFVHLHFAYPHLFKDSFFDPYHYANVTLSTQLDWFVHKIMKGLTSVDVHQKSFYLCRVIATDFPGIFMRHLHLLLAILRSESTMKIEIFVQNTREVVCENIILLLDSVRSYLASSAELDMIVEVLFRIMENIDKYRPTLVPMVSRFSDLVCNLIVENNYKLTDRRGVVQGLQKIFPDLKKIKLLSKLMHSDSSKSMGTRIPTLEELGHSDLPRLLDPYTSNVAHVRKALHDIDRESSKIPSMLVHIVPHILLLLPVHTIADVVDISLKLLMRHLRLNSRSLTREIGDCIVHCLERGGLLYDKITAELKTIVLLLPEHAQAILMHTFSQGMTPHSRDILSLVQLLSNRAEPVDNAAAQIKIQNPRLRT